MSASRASLTPIPCYDTIMLHVLLLCEYPTLNGGEHSMLATLESVCEAGFRVTAVAPATGPLAEEFARRGVEVVPFHSFDESGKRLSQDVRRRRLASILQSEKPDLVHANSLSMGRLCGPLAAQAGLPSIAHLRDIVRISAQAMADLNCQGRLLAVSRATRRFHVAAGLDGEKTRVVYNGVDLARFHPRPGTGWLHRELRFPGKAFLVGVIGQISLRKGQDILVRAAARLVDEAPEIHYVLVGERFSDKDESRRFEADLREAAGAELAGRLRLVGFRDDVDRLMNELSLLVHAARQEPLGRVLLEAAASGLPVVATDVGGTGEIFPPQEQAARLVPPDDADSLAEAIRQLAGDEGLRRELSVRGRRRAEAAFDVKQAAAALVEQYHQTLE